MNKYVDVGNDRKDTNMGWGKMKKNPQIQSELEVS